MVVVFALMSAAALLAGCSGREGTVAEEPVIPTSEPLPDQEYVEAIVRDALDAAELAIRLTDVHGPTDPAPSLAFALAPGTERELAADTFLVCPQGGAACEVVSVTQDANGGHVVELAPSSGPAFLWSGGAGLFSALFAGYEQATVTLVGSDRTHLVTCGQANPCDVSDLRIDEQGADRVERHESRARHALRP